MGWRIIDTKEYIFLKEAILSFTMKTHCRIQKCIHKLIITTSAKTENLSTNFVKIICHLKVDLSFVASDDLTFFKCFRVIFSLKKKTIQFSLSFNHYFQQKRVPKLSICHLLTKSSVWVFDVTNRRNGFYNFQSHH